MKAEPISTPQLGGRALLQLAIPLAIALIGVALWRGLPATQSNEPASPVAPGDGVVRVQTTGPGVEPADETTPWRKGLTVQAATRSALPSVWRGRGAGAFLEELAGVPNQGAEGLHWQFEVNGEYAQRGAGDYPLEPDDRVLWKLAPYE